MIKDLIEQQRQRFIGLCQQHRVVKLYAFGSSVHGPFTKHSDVDLIVEVEQGNPSRPANAYGLSGTEWKICCNGELTCSPPLRLRTRCDAEALRPANS
ncbi:MAG: nucleotidyltransferase domain-containing protein [Flavobacteriales bacterium]|nr:nucleotidyltransferase domain-containing protein [Flavobacteriales bacterium]